MAALNGEPGPDGAATVRIARDGRVEERPLRLGLRTLDAAEVLEGLAAGDVVLLGATPAPGRRVRTDTGAAAAQRAAKGSREDAGSALTNAMGR
jgi:HlyD family secretion protein